MADPGTWALIAAGVGAASSVAGAVMAGGGGGQRQQLPRPTATPRANSVVADAIARRRGTGANLRAGPGGAESGTTAKKQLMGT